MLAILFKMWHGLCLLIFSFGSQVLIQEQQKISHSAFCYTIFSFCAILPITVFFQNLPYLQVENKRTQLESLGSSIPFSLPLFHAIPIYAKATHKNPPGLILTRTSDFAQAFIPHWTFLFAISQWLILEILSKYNYSHFRHSNYLYFPQVISSENSFPRPALTQYH